MPSLILLLFLTAGAYAGVIQGVALEHASGRPLARTLIRLEPIPGSHTPPQPLITRAGRAGQFVFPSVPPGLYRILAQRLGYAAAFYGQRRPQGQAAPVQVEPESKLFAELRLRRFGAVTGTVLDENNIGMPGLSVVAYKAVLPLRAAGRATSDDRGVYRIGGLPPGRYWIRTAGHVLEDGTGLLPTWAPQGREIRDAMQYEARLDSETPDANVRPDPGALYTLRGGISCDVKTPLPIEVTIISETGRQSVQGGCDGGYQVDKVAPGVYEIVASNRDGSQVSYTEINLQSDLVVPVQLSAPPEVIFETGKNTSVELIGHRADLAVLNTPVKIPLPKTSLPPGYWHFKASSGSGQYVESITGRRDIRRPWRPERPADAHEVFIDGYGLNRIRVVVSDKAAQIAGVVRRDNNPVPGVPVFLWPVSPANLRILGGPREVLSDVEGQFRLEGLPPGDYRLVATFDTTEVTPEIIEEARAPNVRVEPAQSVSLDLPLWIAP